MRGEREGKKKKRKRGGEKKKKKATGGMGGSQTHFTSEMARARSKQAAKGR